jgi:hypothetical protein
VLQRNDFGRIEYRTTRASRLTARPFDAGLSPHDSMCVDYATFQDAPLAPPHTCKAVKTLEIGSLQRRIQRLKIFLTLD